MHYPCQDSVGHVDEVRDTEMLSILTALKLNLHILTICLRSRPLHKAGNQSLHYAMANLLRGRGHLIVLLDVACLSALSMRQ